jgi:hypothetical protein
MRKFVAVVAAVKGDAAGQAGRDAMRPRGWRQKYGTTFCDAARDVKTFRKVT